MKYAFAALSLAVLATPAAAQEGSLNLELLCPGQYADTETTSATIRQPGESTRSTAEMSRTVMRTGNARVSLHGDTGELVYPDGRRRALSKVVADERQITAEYERRVLVIPVTWRVEISRTTGDIRVVTGLDVGFAGTCEPVSTKPKF